MTFFINEEKFHSHEQYITGRKIRELGEIPQDWIILLAIERPWEDEVITNDSRVDLARDGKEHFISHAPDHKVEITIDNDPFKVKRGPHSVSQLKAIGHVPGEYELEELVDGVLQPLKDDATVHIKGGLKVLYDALHPAHTSIYNPGQLLNFRSSYSKTAVLHRHRWGLVLDKQSGFPAAIHGIDINQKELGVRPPPTVLTKNSC